MADNIDPQDTAILMTQLRNAQSLSVPLLKNQQMIVSSSSNPMINNNTNSKTGNMLIEACDARNNLFFKICSHKTAMILYYDIVLSRWYPYMCAVTAIPFLLTFLFRMLFDIFGTFSLIVMYISSIGSWIFVLGFLFGFNLRIVKKTTKTFDFWFKMYNALQAGVCHTIIFLIKYRGYSHGTLSVIGVWISGGTLCFLLFFIDGWNINTGSKVMILFTIMCLIFGASYYHYFYTLDVVWDPFDGTLMDDQQFDSSISFKSMYSSSLFNLGLFTLKPLISEAQGYWHINYSKSSKEIDVSGYTKCVGIHEKSYVKWFNTKKSD